MYAKKLCLSASICRPLQNMLLQRRMVIRLWTRRSRQRIGYCFCRLIQNAWNAGCPFRGVSRYGVGGWFSSWHSETILRLGRIGVIFWHLRSVYRSVWFVGAVWVARSVEVFGIHQACLWNHVYCHWLYGWGYGGVRVYKVKSSARSHARSMIGSQATAMASIHRRRCWMPLWRSAGWGMETKCTWGQGAVFGLLRGSLRAVSTGSAQEREWW